ncbi:unnamed protein product, partial [Iphiclides podalirius]
MRETARMRRPKRQIYFRGTLSVVGRLASDRHARIGTRENTKHAVERRVTWTPAEGGSDASTRSTLT